MAKKVTKPVIVAEQQVGWRDLIIKPRKAGTHRCTSVMVALVKEPQGKTRAFARVTLDDQLLLTGLRVVEGMNGLFVSYPNDPYYKGEELKCLFYPVTKELREHIEECVVWGYLIQVASAPVPDYLIPEKESIPLLMAKLAVLADQDSMTAGLIERLRELI